MRFILMSVWIFFCLTGCSLLRNSSKSSIDTSNQMISLADVKLSNEKTTEADFKTFTRFKDSVDHSYEIQIWPKGDFSISSGKGLIGQAEKIRIKGQVLSFINGDQMTSNKENIHEKTMLEDRKVDGMLNIQKEFHKQSSISWKWLIFLGVLMLIICYSVYRRLSIK